MEIFFTVAHIVLVISGCVVAYYIGKATGYDECNKDREEFYETLEEVQSLLRKQWTRKMESLRREEECEDRKEGYSCAHPKEDMDKCCDECPTETLHMHIVKESTKKKKK